MQITNNLNNDISAAPEWFNQAINIKPSEKILDSEKGPLSYSIWPTESKNKNLLIFIHGTGCLLYTSPSPRDKSSSRMPSSA